MKVVTHPNSPNGCWARHGYFIERKGGNRRVYKPNGDLLFDHGRCGYGDEMEYIIKHGLLLPG